MFKRKRKFVSLGIILWLVVALLNSPPVIGFAVEYDALRGTPPFHGCQHNMQGPTGLATLLVPGAWIGVGTKGIPQAAGHSLENADITVTSAGYESLIQTARVMAASGLRLILSPELRRKAKEEHAKWLELYNK